MRNATSLLIFAGVLAFAGCSGSGSDASSTLRIRCLSGDSFCIISCDLGCSQTGCSVTEISENQRLRFKFSDAVDPGSVNAASISIRTATGIAPQGEFAVNGNEVTFVPRVTTVNGVSTFGFIRNETYVITLAGGNSVAQSVRNLAGDGLSDLFSCSVVASLGIVDEDQQAPKAELIAPTVAVGAPVNPTIVLRFSELIDTAPLLTPLGAGSPIRIVLRGTNADGSCADNEVGIALEGVPVLSTEFLGGFFRTVVTFQSVLQLPGNSCITVEVTDDVKDLSGRRGEPAVFQFTTEAGTQPEFTVAESFNSSAQQNGEFSGGFWGDPDGPGPAASGARAGLVGGDGRHGSFDETLGLALPGNVFQWNTDNFTIPASASLYGAPDLVQDGQFYFTDLFVPAGTTVKFVGTSPPVLHVRGSVTIEGTLDVSGVDSPTLVPASGVATGQKISTFNGRTSTLQAQGQPGTEGGPFGGRGGRGALECLNSGPIFVAGENMTEGAAGDDIRISGSHAYGGNAIGTGGRGGALMPASGVWSNPPPKVGNVYSAYFSPGGSGGGFSVPGTVAILPTHIQPFYTIVSDPPVAGGISFDPLPFPPAGAPAGYTSLEHFTIGGSGGGGGGSHGFGLLAVSATPNEAFMAGHGGTGGGGALAIRAGGDITIVSGGQLVSRGGNGPLINGDNPGSSGGNSLHGISSPGGGGSGGSFLLQAGRTIAVSGSIDTSGGRGGRVDPQFVTNPLIKATAEAGAGASGFYRLEAPVVAGGGGNVPAYDPAVHSGDLSDEDNYSGDVSNWYKSNQIFPPSWVRYELDVDTDGDGVVDVTYDDTVGANRAFSTATVNGVIVPSVMGLPVLIEFQGALLNQAGTAPINAESVGPWVPGVGDTVGDGLNQGEFTGFRFRMTYNKVEFPNAVVRALRVVGQS